ncbi:hypothetical protein [Pontibacter beigongshangensis]|uniref:hypothetical protein n=1 Tax=Pontibacter beigongshangensis TaxID=2574733 RepID=UPI00164F3279|nr:hypothetical protein [Pontibacter beigongshangensis]
MKMEAEEIKREIQKVIDQVPEDQLDTILLYLKEMQVKNKSQINANQHLKKILEEDRELLKRLAQ